MLLVMDVGNTITAIGLYEGPELRAQWRSVTGNWRTSDELRVFLNMLLQDEGLEPEMVNGCCVSSVVPSLNAALTNLCANHFQAELVFVEPGVKTGLVIQVDNPKEVGADRIVNAVGALETHEGPLIVIDFGTATTFDAVSARGEYQGGIIVPGIKIAADALFEKCAKLPSVEITKPATVIGKNTIDHIRSGLTYGYADLVDGLIYRMACEMDENPLALATGGFAELVAGIATRIDIVDPHLPLKGLRAVFLKNRKRAA
jgi:type III pantothenate kinase